MHAIGPASAPRLPALQDIERQASALFLTIPTTAGLPADVTSLDKLEQAQRHGLLWVARAGPALIGFALVEPLGDGLHLEELDVLPQHGRQGVGRALLHEVCRHATAQHRTLSLCTFRDIPWNAPFYAHNGFRALATNELWPELAERIQEEAARGLGSDIRVAMKFIGGVQQACS